MTKVLDQSEGRNWMAYQGDCFEMIKGLPDESIHYTIFSPPFASLYTYSNSERDAGNCKNHLEFAHHFRYLVPELLRVTKPGRLLSLHCMQLPTSKERDGFTGLRDFRGELIRAFLDEEAAELAIAMNRLQHRLERARMFGQADRVRGLEDAIATIDNDLKAFPPSPQGWIYHSEVCIWKDPVTAMQRTKAIGLLHKQVVKDSAMSRQGIADYLVTFRKVGVNDERVTGGFTDFVGDRAPAKTGNETVDSINIWQQYASPVWSDINPSDTLQFRSARENDSERHICPLQLQVIRRALQLWTNPGDVVFSPFGGIGSEPYTAVEMGRRGIAFELKRSYYECMVKNLRSLEGQLQDSLFDLSQFVLEAV